MPPEIPPLKFRPTYRTCGPEKGRRKPPATFFHAQPREFVKTRTYFGPDRRRKRVFVDFERRDTNNKEEVVDAPDPTQRMDQEEINEFLNPNDEYQRALIKTYLPIPAVR